ncbi:hypothetical protein T492DRAFT_993296 [Pavlovales sp. CCMP2436]|nr:hypothetical protein T492DRAFT_993296 [Pavlovales sp. CCMP2436]
MRALQDSISDPSGPTHLRAVTLEASVRSQELSLQKAFGARNSAEAEVRELRALAASQAELSEQYSSEARREQKRAHGAIEALALDNEQLRVLLHRPRSAAHRDELLEMHAAEVQRLRERLDELERAELALTDRAHEAERRADFHGMHNSTALAMIQRAQSLVV